VCAPSGAGAAIYFSELLTNSGDMAARITKVEASGTNLRTVDYYIDGSGPSQGEYLGTFASSAEEPLGPEANILARMTSADGTSVEPGKQVALVMEIVPKSTTEDASLKTTVVGYTVGSDSYEETINVEYTVRPGVACD
jgi:hypothetical protein